MAVPTPAVQIPGIGAVSADNLNTFLQACATVDQARTIIGLNDMMIFLQGQNYEGDGLGGAFRWNSSLTIASDDDGVTTILPYGCTSGAWVRLGVLNTFGANSFGGNGYQVFSGPGIAPGASLIINWGQIILTNTTGTMTWLKPYPLISGPVVVTPVPASPNGGYYQVTEQNNFGFTLVQAVNTPQAYNYIGIGF